MSRKTSGLNHPWEIGFKCTPFLEEHGEAPQPNQIFPNAMMLGSFMRSWIIARARFAQTGIEDDEKWCRVAFFTVEITYV